MLQPQSSTDSARSKYTESIKTPFDNILPLPRSLAPSLPSPDAEIAPHNAKNLEVPFDIRITPIRVIKWSLYRSWLALRNTEILDRSVHSFLERWALQLAQSRVKSPAFTACNQFCSKWHAAKNVIFYRFNLSKTTLSTFLPHQFLVVVALKASNFGNLERWQL